MIEDDPRLQKMYKRRELKESSKKLITKYFKWYYHVTQLTPTQAILEADQEEEDGIRLRRRKIVTHLEDYEDYVSSTHANTTVKNSMSVIRSFYKENYIELPPVQRKPSPEPITITTDDLPSREDIKLALEVSRPRNKAIILLNCSSGMGQSEIISLTFKHLQDAVSKYKELTLNELVDIGETIEVGPLRWTLKRYKTGSEYTTFSTPESYEAIIRYIQLYPPENLTDDTPLFRRLRYNDDKPMAERRFGLIYERINNRLEFGKSKDGRNLFRSHNLRKFCANQLKIGIGFDNAQFILGHRIKDNTRGAYLKPDLDELYNLYYENMGRVTITREVEVHTTTNEEVERMKEERAKDRAEMQAMKKEIHKLQKRAVQEDKEKLKEKKGN